MEIKSMKEFVAERAMMKSHEMTVSNVHGDMDKMVKKLPFRDINVSKAGDGRYLLSFKCMKPRGEISEIIMKTLGVSQDNIEINEASLKPANIVAKGEEVGKYQTSDNKTRFIYKYKGEYASSLKGGMKPFFEDEDEIQQYLNEASVESRIEKALNIKPTKSGNVYSFKLKDGSIISYNTKGSGRINLDTKDGDFVTSYETVNKMKKAVEQSGLLESTEYKEFFQKKLEKYGVGSPDELEEEDRKKFFDEVDAEWKAKDEMNEAKKVAESYEEFVNKFDSSDFEVFTDVFNSFIRKHKVNRMKETEFLQLIALQMMSPIQGSTLEKIFKVMGVKK